MRICDHEQGSKEWLEARLGCPSASNFGKLITPTGKPSAQAKQYICELISQGFMMKIPESFTNEWMERGTLNEPKARQLYEIAKGLDVQEIGFCKHEVLECGASPDGLVGSDGGLEIKCPAPARHVEYLYNNEVPVKYLPQIQGCMWITGRQWWDFVSYHETMPALIVRVERDDLYISSLEEEVTKACEEIQAGIARIRSIK